ncbi:hypothetical protein X777_14612 [Ooceraea biroi]|uniref:Uncharacterized protein n=1 Tax=Ooceraea biroi TaxID=2015173 RepID=A0A026WXW7_OOCBI|nr:hypothetical protein X777_14612 [Ooceraea biroi]
MPKRNAMKEKSLAVRDVTMSVTSLPEYPARIVRRKLGRGILEPISSPYDLKPARGISRACSHTRKRSDDAAADESGVSERDTTRKDDGEDDGTVGGLGGGNFVDATFPAGERCSITGHRTERASVRWTETFSKVTGNGSDHALQRTCSTVAAK